MSFLFNFPMFIESEGARAGAGLLVLNGGPARARRALDAGQPAARGRGVAGVSLFIRIGWFHSRATPERLVVCPSGSTCPRQPLRRSYL